MSVISTCTGDNSDLISAVARLYRCDGMTVADITYGKGVFWRKIDTTRFKLIGSDLFTIPPRQLEFHPSRELVRMDFRKLEHLQDGTCDVVVFDPPYTHNPGKHQTDARYRLAATSRGMYHADIMREFYGKGMAEAVRVLKPYGGQLWVKCKDEVESSVQRWSHIEVYNIALGLGMFARDLFILVPSNRTSHNRWDNQYHARKTHSYLWIFERPRARDLAALRRAGIVLSAASD